MYSSSDGAANRKLLSLNGDVRRRDARHTSASEAQRGRGTNLCERFLYAFSGHPCSWIFSHSSLLYKWTWRLPYTPPCAAQSCINDRGRRVNTEAGNRAWNMAVIYCLWMMYRTWIRSWSCCGRWSTGGLWSPPTHPAIQNNVGHWWEPENQQEISSHQCTKTWMDGRIDGRMEESLLALQSLLDGELLATVSALEVLLLCGGPLV